MDLRTRILNEATKMFYKYGIKSITMSHIASETGISKRTLYETFSDKDNLIASIISDATQEHRKMCINSIENAKNVIEAIFLLIKHHNNTFNKINPLFFNDLKKYHSAIFNQIVQRWQNRDYSETELLLERGVKESLFNNEINIQVVSLFIHKTMNILKTEEFAEIKREDIIKSIFMPYFEGISTEKGRELIKNQLNT